MRGATEERHSIAALGDGKHANVLEITGSGMLPSGPYFYLDMILCDFSLKDYLSDPDAYAVLFSSRPSDLVFGPNHQSRVWEVILQACQGLSYIHQRGGLHLNLKPRNSIIPLSSLLNLVLYNRNEGIWKVSDFGYSVARMTKIYQMTGPAELMDSYRAPELTCCFINKLASPIRKVDESTDIWSLGCIIYELLTGKYAFLNANDALQGNLDWTFTGGNVVKFDERARCVLRELSMHMVQTESGRRLPIRTVLDVLSVTGLWDRTIVWTRECRHYEFIRESMDAVAAPGNHSIWKYVHLSTGR